MGEVLAVRDAYRAQERTMPMQECSTSGSTKREFYQQREISEKSLYYWLTLLIHNSVLLNLFLFSWASRLGFWSFDDTVSEMGFLESSEENK